METERMKRVTRRLMVLGLSKREARVRAEEQLAKGRIQARRNRALVADRLAWSWALRQTVTIPE